jgi:hypothetical protein
MRQAFDAEHGDQAVVIAMGPWSILPARLVAGAGGIWAERP